MEVTQTLLSAHEDTDRNVRVTLNRSSLALPVRNAGCYFAGAGC